ncbi:MAG: DUF222 domain-containing protein [Propionibacteriales bacterium]|nr:DUF222 domain-containing protein [Propionibacteriales bacterium]
MTTGVLDQVQQHPLLGMIAALEAAVSDDATAPAWTLTPAEVTSALPRLARVVGQLTGCRLQLLREADRYQIGDSVGFGSTAGWWASVTRATKQTAHREVALAGRLDHEAHAATAAAVSAGNVTIEQAAVILDAVEALPSDLVTSALRKDAELHLVGLAHHHDPRELRILGRRILDVLAPAISEEAERRVLEAEEQHAAATASFTMSPDGHGSMTGSFTIPTLAGEMLRKHLDALAAPRRSPAADVTSAPSTARTDHGQRVARPLRLGHAFTEYIETRAASGTPKAGGIAATVVVTMTLDTLLGAGTAASLDTGERISASEARRLACEAGIIPAVVGTRSQPLDVGRKSRFHTEPQRVALALRDRGCAAEHCDWPPGRCHAHHPDPWSRGGGTSVINGMLLCPRHHTLAHDARYQLKATKNGKVTFSRRR